MARTAGQPSGRSAAHRPDVTGLRSARLPARRRAGPPSGPRCSPGAAASRQVVERVRRHDVSQPGTRPAKNRGNSAGHRRKPTADQAAFRGSPSARAGPTPYASSAVISVASRSMTSQPFRIFPATTSHTNPAGGAAISHQTRARTLARPRGDLVQGWPGRPAPAWAAPSCPTSARRRPARGGLVGRCRSCCSPRARSPPPWTPEPPRGPPAGTSRPAPSAAVSPTWSASLMEQYVPAWPRKDPNTT